jgi:signal transduction histidine kinase
MGVSAAGAMRALSLQRLGIWALASGLFLIAFWMADRQRWLPRLWALQSVAVIGMTIMLCSGYEGFLLALIAAQLGWHRTWRHAVVWIALQTTLLAVAIGIDWNVRSAILLTPPYLGLQILLFMAARLLARESTLRMSIQDAHGQLLALQHQLADRTRIEERLRMTQDLHDTFGHQLTALSLHLEALAHQSGTHAQQSLRLAQASVQALLTGVKSLVQTLDDERPVDLPLELTLLAQTLPRPRIHLTCPTALPLAPDRAHALLRCIQETVTNAIRHGAAQNMWIDISQDAACLRVVARDDGGAAHVQDGFGLTGMRRRLTELGGSLTIDQLPDGVQVRADLPVAARA